MKHVLNHQTVYCSMIIIIMMLDVVFFLFTLFDQKCQFYEITNFDPTFETFLLNQKRTNSLCFAHLGYVYKMKI